jgi:hypothetical protein
VEEGAKAITDFVSKHLKTLIDALDEILRKIPIIGRALDAVFGKRPSNIPGVPGTPTPGGAPTIPPFPTPTPPPEPTPTPTPRPPGGGVGGTIGQFLSGGLLGNIFAGATAVSSIIGNFQQAHQETSLNAIEHNTRFSMMFLGERGDQGILGQTFKIADNTYWSMKSLDTISVRLNSIFDKIGTVGGNGGGVTNIFIDSAAVSNSSADIMASANQLVKLIRNSGVARA